MQALCVFRVRRILPTVLGLLAIAAIAAPAEQDTHGHLTELAHFLDKTTPNDQRRAIFAGWRDSALKGDSDAQYVVGSIYRRGDEIVPHVVERHADQARRFLSTAAAHGRLLAMAKMAELELGEDHPQEAMIWAQIFGYYRGWAGKDDPSYGKHNEHQPTLYYEDLLRRVSARVSQKLGDVQTPLVVQQVNTFIAAHDADIRAQLWRDGISPRWAGSQAKVVNAKSFRRVNIPTGTRNMASEWVLDFAPDGSVKTAMPFDAIPNFVGANSHHGLVAQYETDAASTGQQERYALKTVDLKKADWPLGPTLTR